MMREEGVAELPNRLFADGRSILARFGYRHVANGAERDDWAAMWDLLRPDFATAERPDIATYDVLSEEAQSLARAYMRVRLEADRNLEACERLHVQLYADGIDKDVVEDYAVVRDAYEDSVEAFGAAREKLAPHLSR